MDVVEAPGGCAPPPENDSSGERGNMLSILLCLQPRLARPHAPITQPGAGSVWSPRRWERYAARNTIDQKLSAPACSACTPMCFPFPVNVFALARWRAGKGAVYEIIYVEPAGAVGGGGLHSWRRRPNTKQPAVCIKVENIIDGSLF